MKKQKLLFVLLLTALYDYLFWNQNFGLNALAFFIPIIVLVSYFNQEAIKKPTTRLMIVGTFISAVLVALYGSTIATVTYLLSFTVMIGFFHQSEIRTVYTALLTSLVSVLSSAGSFLELLKSNENKKSKRFFSWIPLSILPFILLIIFYYIFKAANPIFDQLTNTFWNTFWNYFSAFFTHFSLGRFFFVSLGFMVVAGFLLNPNFRKLLAIESSLSDNFIRLKNNTKKNKYYYRSFGKTLVAFKNEYKSALIMTYMINAMLLVVNFIDIKWLWFNFDYTKEENLSQFVHEGTYLLIISILLSIGIILYYFKGNINLLRNNKTLKMLSYAWIAQNAILVISVAVRNYHYIHQHGLAYKRIGVLVFLILVIGGLITSLIKVNNKKSGFYLFRTNSWILYFVILGTACFDWDMIIVKHNINHPNEKGIDMVFLNTLSDKTLYILSQNKSFFPKDYPPTLKIESYSDHIDGRIEKFTKEYQNKDWQSFNLSEYNCYNDLITKTQK